MSSASRCFSTEGRDVTGARTESRRRLSVLFIVLVACTSTGTGDRSSTTTTDATTSTSAPTGWVEMAPMTVARSEHPGVLWDGEIVVVGGLIEIGVGRRGPTATVEAYSPEADSWRDLPDLPQPIHHGMAAVIEDRLFVIGGYSPAGDPVDTLWELDGDQWRVLDPLPRPVGAGAAVVLEGAIHVVGGLPDGGLYRFHVGEGTWVELTSPGERREHLAAAVLGGELWAIGGRWDGVIFDTTEIFDPESGSWRSGPTLNEARSGFGAAVVDGSIVVAGGELFSPETALDSVEILTNATDAWSYHVPLPYGLHGNPLVETDGDVYLPGGSTRARDVVNDGRTYRLGWP